MDRGFERIALAGVGAGACLALLAHAGATRTPGLATPIGTVALSPWTDLSSIVRVEDRHEDDGLLYGSDLTKAVHLYLGDIDRWAVDASPLNGDLSRLPPVQIQVANDDVLLSHSLLYAEKMRWARGHVDLHIWDGVHSPPSKKIDQPHFSKDAMQAAGVFLKDRLVHA